MWNSKDTPIRLQECEEWLLMHLKKGRFGRDSMNTTETTNVSVYPNRVREKVYCRPTAFGMHDMDDMLRMFDGVRDTDANGPTWKCYDH